jgi:4-amino-4-deoxy-L-arabinose transferase-like glycosyltransferase
MLHFVEWVKRHRLTILICIGIFLLNLVIQAGTNPSYYSMRTDSSVFAYCGQQILGGHLLYRDCYDNKPPLVYYLDAAAILIAGPNPGSIWLFQTLWMAGVGIAFFLIMRAIWGAGPALLAGVIFLLTALSPGFYENGNLTESYALLPQALVIGALYGFITTRKTRFLVEIGALTAAAFLLKPTYISLGAAASLVVVCLTIQTGLNRPTVRLAARRSLILVGSGLAVPLLVAAYWAMRGGLSDLWYAVFTHNRIYVAEGFSFFSARAAIVKLLSVEPLASLTLAGGLAAIVFGLAYWNRMTLWFKQRSNNCQISDSLPVEIEAAHGWLMLALLVSIPFEVLFITISGRNFGHYYLPVMPALAACSGYLFYRVTNGLRRRLLVWGAAAGLVILFIPWGIAVLKQDAPTRSDLAQFIRNPGIGSLQLSDAEKYAIDHTQPTDSILTWAADPYLNFVTGRRSPTRFVFSLHLLKPTPAGSTGFDELLSALEKDPPALIFAQINSSSGLPDFWISPEKLCPGCSPEARQGLLAFNRYSQEHYKFTLQIADWYIFRRIH